MLFETKINNFEKWICQHGFDPDTGYNIDKNRSFKSFRRDVFDEAMHNLSDKIREKKI